MSKPPDFDLASAHRYFSSECFNHAWDLIEKPDRTPEEDEEMVLLSLTSCWHWSRRSDCTAKNLSISYWQISHIYSLLQQVENARTYAQRCLEVSQNEDVPPFYLGYAFEALARAEAIAGETARMKAHIASALQVAEKITDLEAHKQLLHDLESIQ